jgi:O-antigen ligase
MPWTFEVPTLAMAMYISVAAVPSIFDANFLGAMTISRLYALLLVLVGMVKLMRPGRTMHGRRPLVYALLVFMPIVLSNATSLIHSESLLSTLTLGLNVAVFLFVAYGLLDWDSTISLERIAFLTLLAVLVVGLTRPNALQDVQIYGASRLSLGDAANPNRVGEACAILGAIVIWPLFGGRKTARRGQVEGIVGGVVTVWLIIQTGSRDSLLALLLCVLIIALLVGGRRGLGGLAIIAGLALAAIPLFLLVQWIDPVQMSRYSLASIVAGRGTGRLDIWTYLWHVVIPQHFWLGTGISGATVKVAMAPSLQLYQNAAHNIVLDLWTQLGVPGGSVVLYVLVSLGWEAVRSVRSRSVAAGAASAGLIVALLLGIGETAFDNKLLWLMAGLVMASHASARRHADIPAQHVPSPWRAQSQGATAITDGVALLPKAGSTGEEV